jgi:hypothetical protein
MSRKTKCCKKYKRGEKYCPTCPLLLRRSQTENADSRRMTDAFPASAAGSASQRRNFVERREFPASLKYGMPGKKG